MIDPIYSMDESEEIIASNCVLGVCDGSGLVETECQFGLHFVKCPCRSVNEEI